MRELRLTMFELFVLIVILGLVTYRVGRFLVLDTLIDQTRADVHMWLESRNRLVWSKIAELIGCPYCITIWIAAGATLAHRWLVGPFPMPVWVWLGAATVALIAWRIVDWEPDKEEE